jgi:type I restriction enzyme R subunit
VVHELAPNEEKPEQWSEEKTRNETDRLRIRLNKTIEQELADDPYAQTVFAELLKQTIAQAEAMSEQPGKLYALFRDFDERVQTREVEGIPKDFGGDAHARAYFGILRMIMGEREFSVADQGRLVEEAHTIDAVVRDAVTVYSLNPQDIEAAIRRTLLPRLFPLLGMDRALQAIKLVIQVMHIGLGRKQ